jgi:ATP-dependent helicase/nuclease subunit B
LDDGRFPTGGGQDPLLLDEERERISADLPTASGRLAKETENLALVLARLRGNVTLSYCSRDLIDDRALFPSSALWSAYRLLSGNREGTQEDLLKWLPGPASFAPSDPRACADLGEWWLWRACSEGGLASPQQAIAEHFPHLGRGLRAREARQSDLFTEFDGYVPKAGPANDPTDPNGPVLSASRLETFGTCPLEYFLRYVLEIALPEELEIDPSIWLKPKERGELLHTVFRDFMTQICKEGSLPERERHQPRLQELLAREIAVWQERKPPHNQEAFTREVRELQRIARVFLHEEQLLCRNNQPLCCEASLGLPADGAGTSFDSPDPSPVLLPDGKMVRARGRIDRIDELPLKGRRRLVVWDYKTGSSSRYKRGDPFQQGRFIQNLLYLEMVESRLQEIDPGCSAVQFGYFFPGLRDHGERIVWSREQLQAGKAVLADLCALMKTGCFPFTETPGDVRYSDYLSIFGDVEELAEAAAHKLVNPANRMLEPFRRLRGD